MDLSFFGLVGHPFCSSSDEEGPYLTDSQESLITELRAGLKAPHGITLLIGDAGTGKSTLVRRLVEEIADSCTVAHLPTTGPGLRHLLNEIIEQLGGSPPVAAEELALLEMVSSLARARAQHGRTTLVVIDDAHELPAKTIERIGRLFGEDPADPSMLHVVLVGRPQLLDRMNAANDRTILKHLVQVCRMDPIGPEESFRYIADRVAKVGGEVDQLFTQDALRLIVKRAHGNPGRIDAICSAALQRAADSGERAIGAETVDLACMGVEGFRADGSPAERDGGDPMQYIFGDEEEEHGGANVQRRLRGQADSSNDGENRKASDQAQRLGGLAAVMAKLREQFSVGDSRRRLLLWAVGLIAVLIGFASVTSRTGEQGDKSPDGETTVAAAPKEVAPAGQPATAVKPGSEPVTVPSSALRSDRLVVKRQGEAGEDVEPQVVSPPAAVTPPRDADAAKAGSLEDEAGKGDADGRSGVQAPQVAGPAAPTKPSSPASPAPASPSEPASATPPPSAAAGGTKAGAPPPTAPAKPGSAVQQPVAPEQTGPAAPSKTAQPGGATASVSGTAQATVGSDKPQAASPGAKTTEVASAKAAKPAPAATKAPAGTKVAAATQPAAGGGKYTVQIGAFKSRANAEALLARVQKSYPDGRIIAAEGPNGVFRVVSGAFATKSDAASRARTLTGSGYTAYVRDMPR